MSSKFVAGSAVVDLGPVRRSSTLPSLASLELALSADGDSPDDASLVCNDGDPMIASPRRPLAIYVVHAGLVDAAPDSPALDAPSEADAVSEPVASDSTGDDTKGMSISPSFAKGGGPNSAKWSLNRTLPIRNWPTGGNGRPKVASGAGGAENATLPAGFDNTVGPAFPKPTTRSILAVIAAVITP
jgi:hypothetical protein